MIQLVVAIALCVLVHLLTMAAVGRAFGVSIEEFSFGLGPTLVRIGRMRLGPIPLGGYVKFLHSEEDLVSDDAMHTAYDGKSTTEQILVAIAGCMALLSIATLVLGNRVAVQTALDAPGQLLHGGVFTMDAAKQIQRHAVSFVQSAPFLDLLGVVAAKWAAINLLPLPGCNGGKVIAVLAGRFGLRQIWPPVATLFLLMAYVIVLASWCLSFVLNATAS